MRAVFASVGWAVNRMESDYGVDFDIQMFESGKTTGEWFKVQLKSSENTQFSANGDFISETLPIDHAVHYSTQIRDPIFLIHADVKSKRTFWFAPQLAETLTAQDPRESVTVRIEMRNELPATLAGMVASLRQIQLKLGARAVSESGISDFAKTVEDRDQEALIKNSQNKTDVLRLNRIHALATEGKLKEAKEGAGRILESSDSSIERKYSGLLEEERIEYLDARKMNAPQSATPAIRVAIARKLRCLTRKGPPALKFSALLLLKGAELDVLTFRDLGLSMNVRGHVLAGDPLIAMPLAVEQLKNSHRIIKKYNQCVRLARYASNSRYRWALPHALLRVVESVGWFILRLKMEGQLDAAREYKASALRICHMAVWIAEQNEDDLSLDQATTTVMLLVGKWDDEGERKEAVQLAREIIAKIKDAQQRRAAEKALDRSIRRISGEKIEGDPEHDVLRQIVENRASTIGIDMTNLDAPAVQAVRLGIKDASPERAIRHCQHAFTSISGNVSSSVNVIAGLLQLPSMRAKIIHCDLHDYVVESRTLDTGLASFKSEYCDNCNDVSPRPPDWKYSEEWQQEENRRHRGFMAKFYQRRDGAQE
jgi:hypothetical protein